MSIINNGLLLASGADAATTYQISRSLRFNSADSAHLSRNCSAPSSSWTLSLWVKRSKLSTYQYFFAPQMSGFNVGLVFNNDDRLRWYDTDGTNNYNYYSTAVFRDVSAWYHIVMRVSAGAFTIYVNNVSHITGNLYAGLQSGNWYLGCAYSGSPIYFTDAYLADIYFIDGSAKVPGDFAETDATTGQWIPKTYSGSYGTTGFRLSLSDNSGTTSTTLGKDAAGSNNWTPNNFSVASGSGNDSLVDSPTSYGTDTGAGGEVRGNYALANALDNGGQTLANGNLDITGISSNWRSTRGTIGMSSGKWYWEVTIGFTNGASNQSLLGIATGAASISGNYASAGAYGWEYYSSNGNKFNNGSNPSYGASYTNGDVIGVAFDADAGSLTFYKNGSSQGTAYTGLTSGPYFPSFSLYGVSLVSFNGGQRTFAYTAPSGFKALCDTSLTAPTIALPSTVFDVKLWTGNGSSQTISGLGFSPDFLWTSVRDVTGYFKYLVDSVRGSDKYLVSFNTNAEGTDSQGITSLTSSGFTVGSSAQVNENGRSMVAWAWDAGTSTVTNNNGSISSQVRANASAGFSVVTFNSGGSNGEFSVGHGLGVAPRLIIMKSRTRNGGPWWVHHLSATDTTTKYLQLSTTSAVIDNGGSGSIWGAALPTSTLFGFSVGAGRAHTQNEDIVSYCFAPVSGYSNAFTYSGTGSTDGPFCFLGFRPRLILLKVSNTTGPWYLFDTARNTYNVMNNRLEANSNSAEASDRNVIDALSNGFKLRDVDAVWNQSGNTYIGFAWAESPFQYSRAR